MILAGEKEEFAFQSLAEAKLELYDDSEDCLVQELRANWKAKFPQPFLNIDSERSQEVQLEERNALIRTVLSDTKQRIQKTAKLLEKTHEYQVQKQLKF